MALQKNYSDKYGNSHNAAYYRVVNITIDLENSKASASLAVYKDVDARNSKKMPIEYKKFIFEGDKFSIFNSITMEQKNPIKGVYDEIKTYSEFEGSTDV